MERVQALIDKLIQQKQNNDTPAQMLITVQLLQNELSKFQAQTSPTTSRVAVVMPLNRVLEPVPQEQSSPAIEKQKEDSSANESYLPEPVIQIQEPKEEQKIFYTLQETDDYPFDPMKETPTLLHQREKEIHEILAEQKESLNDKLKQEKQEVAHVLKDSPVKDLRKAIGINDRFVFVRELFRGDENMYERSIRTINNFQVLQEAEYWINRELKVKLGWNDNREEVQHFYQLVRRRFS
ncbi:MAG: hypothetical protein ICV66_09190 [Chitinophagaceae bacterium]|nr:hypothetical protein [Chitinophagaceae bacterium]